MCVACLNVSTQPCAHRWYQLVRSCQPTNHLANCSEKLKLQGWESRVETCPFCHETEEVVHESTHRLFGSNVANSAASTTVSPLSSTTLNFSSLHLTRHSSVSSDSSSNSSSTTTSATEEEEHRRRRRGQRHRDMNARLHLYLTARPHEVLPSARKNYPSHPRPRPPPSSTTLSEEDVEDDDDDTIISTTDLEVCTRTLSSSTATAVATSATALRRGGSLLAGKWKSRLGRSVTS